MSWLARILASKRDELSRLAPEPSGPYAERAPRGDAARAALLRRSAHAPLGLLAEVKPRSPSAGALSSALSPAARAVVYARGGVRAVSVLCDAPFFGGGFDVLAACRAACDAAGLATPLLAKEFVLDPRQVDLAATHGADLVLLVVRIVPPEVLAGLVVHARRRGLEPLVEVATEAELDVALEAGATFVGVNARDLDTLAMDAERAARVLARIPAGVVAAHLSGLRGPDDVRALARGRADAALVGEALMRRDDPAPALAELVAAAGPFLVPPASGG